MKKKIVGIVIILLISICLKDNNRFLGSYYFYIESNLQQKISFDAFNHFVFETYMFYDEDIEDSRIEGTWQRSYEQKMDINSNPVYNEDGNKIYINYIICYYEKDDEKIKLEFIYDGIALIDTYAYSEYMMIRTFIK